MTDMEFIPLKTPEGQLLGHARIKDGYVGLSFKNAQRGRAAILTETGSVAGAIDGKIPVSSRVLAAALHEDGRLICYGVARGVIMSADSIRRRLVSSRADIRPAPEKPRPEPAQQAEMPETARQGPRTVTKQERVAAGHAAQEPLPADRFGTQQERVPAGRAALDAEREAPEPVPENRARYVPVRPGEPAQSPVISPQRGGAGEPDLADVVAAYDRGGAALWNRNVFGAYRENENARREEPFDDAPRERVSAMRAETAAAAVEPLSQPMMPPQDTAAESEAFFALLKRSDAAFRRISEPMEPVPEPEPFHAVRSTPYAPSWHDEVDAMLGRTAEEARQSVPNPFPHIFPNAAFVRVVKEGVTDRLEGDWRRGPERFHIYAVPGSYSPVPPPELAGYTRYIRSRAGGFWVRVIEA